MTFLVLFCDTTRNCLSTCAHGGPEYEAFDGSILKRASRSPVCNYTVFGIYKNINMLPRTNVGEKMYISSKNVVARTIHGSYFLIDITDNYSGDRCALYEINSTGMFLWEKLSTKKSVDELAGLLKAAIVDDIDYQIIYSDVMEFICTLAEKKFISEVD